MDTQIYIYRIEKEYIEAHLDEVIAALPEWRRKKAEKLRRTESKVVSAAAGSLLYHVLDKYYGISPEEISINEGPKGKPEADGIFFNISHSGEYIALAVSDKNIGIDIEYKDDREGRIAGRFFTDEERRYICAAAGLSDDQTKSEMDDDQTESETEDSWTKSEMVDDQTQQRFRRIWTMKESCIKFLGDGLSIPLRSFSVDPISCTADISGFKLSKLHFLCFDVLGEDGKSYSVAVCTENIPKNTEKYIQYYGCIFPE